MYIYYVCKWKLLSSILMTNLLYISRLLFYHNFELIKYSCLSKSIYVCNMSSVLKSWARHRCFLCGVHTCVRVSLACSKSSSFSSMLNFSQFQDKLKRRDCNITFYFRAGWEYQGYIVLIDGMNIVRIQKRVFNHRRLLFSSRPTGWILCSGINTHTHIHMYMNGPL